MLHLALCGVESLHFSHLDYLLVRTLRCVNTFGPMKSQTEPRKQIFSQVYLRKIMTVIVWGLNVACDMLNAAPCYQWVSEEHAFFQTAQECREQARCLSLREFWSEILPTFLSPVSVSASTFHAPQSHCQEGLSISLSCTVGNGLRDGFSSCLLYGLSKVKTWFW